MPKVSSEVPSDIAPGFSTDVYSWDTLKVALSRPIQLNRTVEVHLFRHGETTTNARSLVTGSQNVPLTERGRDQARLLGLELDQRYNVAFHSALKRSRETLQIALKAGGVEVGPVYPDWRLNERSLGELELKPSYRIEAFARGDLSYAPSGGDSYEVVSRRLLSFLLDLARYVHDRDIRKILICGHMGPMRILMGILEQFSDPVAVLEQSFGNTEICHVKWRQLVFPLFLK
jgi:broad specificity phosphatase PhoE